MNSLAAMRARNSAQRICPNKKVIKSDDGSVAVKADDGSVAVGSGLVIVLEVIGPLASLTAGG